MEKVFKQKKGITLIALVITVIVLLILAGISISMLSGDNGILQRATQSKEKTERAEIIETAQMDILGKQTENSGDITENELKDILIKYGALSDDEEKILEKTFTRFPQAVNDMTDLVTNYLMEERDKTKYLIDSVVEMEINYLFTNDYEYLNNFTTFIPKHQRPVQNNMGNNNQPKGQQFGNQSNMRGFPNQQNNMMNQQQFNQMRMMNQNPMNNPNQFQNMNYVQNNQVPNNNNFIPK